MDFAAGRPLGNDWICPQRGFQLRGGSGARRVREDLLGRRGYGHVHGRSERFGFGRPLPRSRETGCIRGASIEPADLRSVFLDAVDPERPGVRVCPPIRLHTRLATVDEKPTTSWLLP